MEQSINDYIKGMFSQLQPEPDAGDNFQPFALSNVPELILDGSKIREITMNDSMLLSQFTNLLDLSCNRTGLTSLNGLPYMPSLQTFEATDNFISGGLEIIAHQFPNLIHLELGGNLIRDLNEILPLKALANLKSLGLALNPISEDPLYKTFIFSQLQQISYLDNADVNGNEKMEDEESSEDDSVENIALKDFFEKDYENDSESDSDYEIGQNETLSEDMDEDMMTDDELAEEEEDEIVHPHYYSN